MSSSNSLRHIRTMVVGWSSLGRRAGALAAVLAIAACFSTAPESPDADEEPPPPPPPPPGGGQEAPPANPTPANLSTRQDVRDLLASLASLTRTGTQALVGQDIGNIDFRLQENFDDHYVALDEAAGALPAILSMDYGFLAPRAGKMRIGNQMAFDHCAAGGAVTISVQANNPFTGGGPDDRSFAGGTFSDVLTEGTPAHAAWRAHLDAIADGLAALRDAGVPVLWRPFHDMNTDTYWWGQGAGDFAALWRDMFDHFTNERRLDNLLWVYAPTTGEGARPLDSAYPGAAYVDVIAVSHRSADMAALASDESFQRLGNLGKPLALGQVGPVSTDGSFDTSAVIEAIRTSYPEVAYFTFAADQRSPEGVAIASAVGNLNTGAMMSDPDVITLDSAADHLPGCGSP